jgi:hypothetical protein
LTKALLSHAEPLAVLSGQLTASVIGLWGASQADLNSGLVIGASDFPGCFS